jgi:hypothetical protein
MSPSLDYERARQYTSALEDRLVERVGTDDRVSRRAVLGSLGLASGAALVGTASADDDDHAAGGTDHGNFGARGEFDEGFDPHEFLRTFNTGFDGQDTLTQDVFEEDGERVRYFEMTAVDTTIEVAPGIEFSAWPGRCWLFRESPSGNGIRTTSRRIRNCSTSCRERPNSGASRAMCPLPPSRTTPDSWRISTGGWRVRLIRRTSSSQTTT